MISAGNNFERKKLPLKSGFFAALIFISFVIILSNTIFAQCSGGACGVSQGGSSGDQNNLYKDSATGELTSSSTSSSGTQNPQATQTDIQANLEQFIGDSNLQKSASSELRNYGFQQKSGANSVSGDSTGWEYKNGELVGSDGKKIDKSVLDGSDVTLNSDGGYAVKESDGTITVHPGSGDLLDPSQMPASFSGSECGSCGGGGGGGSGGGGGGGSGGGGGEEGMMQAIQTGLDAASKVLGFKPDAGGSGSGSSGTNAYLSGGNTEINGNKIITDDKVVVEDGEKDALLQPNEEEGGDSGTAELTLNNGLDDVTGENADIGFSDSAGALARVYAPASMETEIINEPTQGDSFSIASSSGSSLTAAVIGAGSSQYVKFIDYGLGVAGQKIIVDIFRSFENVNAEGYGLEIRNGESRIEFNGKKTYYPRRIESTPNNMHEIVNKMDSENYFKLRNYEDEQNFLADGRRIVSVGDKTVRHPAIEGIRIARLREDMWEE